MPGPDFTDDQVASFTALSDVMCTGYHAAVSAGVTAGRSVAVVGDGAVGLCAVIAARKLGAARIIALSRHPDRQALARQAYQTIFWKNVGIRGGVVPARQYIPELLEDVLSGRINPGRVFDLETDLHHVADAYAAMDERRAHQVAAQVNELAAG